MNNYQPGGKKNWIPNPNIIDYNHQRTSAPQANSSKPFWSRDATDNQPVLQPFNTPSDLLGARNPVTSIPNTPSAWNPVTSTRNTPSDLCAARNPVTSILKTPSDLHGSRNPVTSIPKTPSAWDSVTSTRNTSSDIRGGWNPVTSIPNTSSDLRAARNPVSSIPNTQNWNPVISTRNNPSDLLGARNPVTSIPSTPSGWNPVTSTHNTPSDLRGARNLVTSTHSTPAAVRAAWNPATSTRNTIPSQQLYNPFVQDDKEISDDEKFSQNARKSASTIKPSVFSTMEPTSIRRKLETKSGTAFYQGLILYIPSFGQIANSYKGSPAMKMLYASFEFSFKVPLKIEIKKMSDNVQSEASVTFKDHLIAKTINTALAAQNEVCVRALELLSETCYTIQAKESYFPKCKLIDASEMKNVNLNKWEIVSQKYPKVLEMAKSSDIQKAFSIFLDNHTSFGLCEDIICCNLTRQDVLDVKRVVEFFQLTLLPCCMTTNLTKKNTPYVVSIHKYTSAKTLLEILMESGGENDKFKIYSPDTFRDFYKLHHNYWDPALQTSGRNQILQSKTTLDDTELQTAILKPYENVVAEIFEKHKLLNKQKNQINSSELRRAGDDFMKDTLKIDMAHSKTVAPVERMQLLLKYMEQLQEYGSRVLTTGRPEMIKIYHSAIDNLRKDLDVCSKDIEKEQKDKLAGKDKTAERERKKTESHQKRRSRSPIPRKRTPPKVRPKSPGRRSYNEHSKRRSVSPNKRTRSRSPKRSEKRRSASPRRGRGSISPRRRHRSISPRRRHRSISPRNRLRSRSPRRLGRTRDSPPRRARSPTRRASPLTRLRSRSPHMSRQIGESVLETIFKDQFRKYIETLRTFRFEIEDTPIERRNSLTEKMISHQEQLRKFYSDVMNNQRELGSYFNEIKICQDEIEDQVQLIEGKPGPNDLPRNLTPPHWMNVQSFGAAPQQQSSYSLPGPSFLGARAPLQPRPSLYGVGFQPIPGVVSTRYPLSMPPKYTK